jgi:hypothetical protein
LRVPTRAYNCVCWTWHAMAHLAFAFAFIILLRDSSVYTFCSIRHLKYRNVHIEPLKLWYTAYLSAGWEELDNEAQCLFDMVLRPARKVLHYHHISESSTGALITRGVALFITFRMGGQENSCQGLVQRVNDVCFPKHDCDIAHAAIARARSNCVNVLLRSKASHQQGVKVC